MILPIARITPAIIPGTAAGSTILKIVRSFPAPSPKLPSLYVSGTDFNASSVVLIISGRIIMDMVKAPARMEYPHLSADTKNNIPNRPYTMDGIPDKVSAVIRMIPTNLFPFFAYSTRKMAEKIPNGIAMTSDNAVIMTVFTSAGIKDAFSVLYSNENKEGLIFGSPFIKI